MYNIENMRTISLLRVSTNKQTSDDKDIPSQREIVNAFIKREKLKFVKEFTEGGVSGFKLTTAQRDALVTIKRMAENKEFDILVVYKSDRIGRTTDESPLVVKYLNDHGIRIFTAFDGEIKTETQMDKLMTYLTFWQNETESVKLSERSTDYQILLIQNGYFRGGGRKAVPYGYKLENIGRKNVKGKPVLDLVIDEEQSKIVKLIYDLSVNCNMGTRAIAGYLNENGYKNKIDNQNGWTFRTVMNILHNITYKGYLHMKSKVRGKDIVSKKQENLVIIDEELWNKNQEIMKSRTTTHKTPNKQESNIGYKALLSGFIYCGYCGSKMYLWSNHKYYKLKDGTKKHFVKHSYKCYSKLSKGTIDCDGQSTYSVNKINSIVENSAFNYLQHKSEEVSLDSLKYSLNGLITKTNIEISNKQKEITNHKKELTILKNEVVKSLLGTSKFAPEILQSLISEKESIITQLESDIERLEKHNKKNKGSLLNLTSTGNPYVNFIEKYQKSNTIEQRELLHEIIEKVIVFRDTVEIRYNMDKITFLRYS